MESIVADLATEAGHQIAAVTAVRGGEANIRSDLVGWIEDPDVDVVLLVGEGRTIATALAPLVEQALPDLETQLRTIALEDGTGAALASKAMRCGATFVFVLPAGESAVR